MTYLRELREREHARKLSRTWAAAQAGRSGLPTQMFPSRQSGSGQPSVGTQVPQAGPVAAADPWAISVTTGTQAFAAAGTLASFTGVEPGPVTVGFAPTFPTDTLTIVKPGVYRLDLGHEWATYDGGGTVEILVNGAAMWGPFTDTYGARFATTVNLGLLEGGDEVTVSVAPTAGTEDGTCVTSLVLVEPAAPTVAADAPSLVGAPSIGNVVTTGTSIDPRVVITVPADAGEGDYLVASFGTRAQASVGSALGDLTSSGWDVYVARIGSSVASTLWWGTHYVIGRTLGSETSFVLPFDPGDGSIATHNPAGFAVAFDRPVSGTVIGERVAHSSTTEQTLEVVEQSSLGSVRLVSSQMLARRSGDPTLADALAVVDPLPGGYLSTGGATSYQHRGAVVPGPVTVTMPANGTSAVHRLASVVDFT